MTIPLARPERIRLADNLEISRIVTGLWQIADMERDGRHLDAERAASVMADYAEAGFDSFDMADHYESAEVITGRFPGSGRSGPSGSGPRPTTFTKCCPERGPMTRDVVRAGIGRSKMKYKRFIDAVIYVRDAGQRETVARVHGRYLGHIRPANMLIEASNLVGPHEVEIEAEAVV